jgi:drug/metabolite transporter (DMT)-like permease
MSQIAVKATEDRASLGIAMMLGAWLFFSFIDTSVKWLVLAGLPAFQLAFMRYFAHFFISTWLLGRGGWDIERFKTKHPTLIIFRAYLLTSSTLLNFVAIKYIPLTVTSAIMFATPIVVCALSPWLLREKVGIWRWGAIILGFTGVLVVVRPFGAEFHWAMLLSIHNSVALALYTIITRKLSGIVATETMQFYMGAFGCLVLMPFAIWNWVAPANLFDWMVLVVLGVWGWAGHEMLTRAHSYASASTLSPYAYSFMIYLTLASYLVWGELPDGFTVLGACIIVAAGLIIWARERRA